MVQGTKDLRRFAGPNLKFPCSITAVCYHMHRNVTWRTGCSVVKFLAGLGKQAHDLLSQSCSDDAGGENGLDLQVLLQIPTPLHQKSRRGDRTKEEKEEEKRSLPKL